MRECRPLDNIKIRFPAWITVPQFVLLSSPAIKNKI